MSKSIVSQEALDQAQEGDKFIQVTPDYHKQGKKKGQMIGKEGKLISVTALKIKKDGEVPRFYENEDHSRMIWSLPLRLVGLPKDVERYTREYLDSLKRRKREKLEDKISRQGQEISLRNFKEAEVQDLIASLLDARKEKLKEQQEPVRDFTIPQILLLGHKGAIEIGGEGARVKIVDNPDYEGRQGYTRSMFERVRIAADKSKFGHRTKAGKEIESDDKFYSASYFVKKNNDEGEKVKLKRFPRDKLEENEVLVPLKVESASRPGTLIQLPLFARRWKDVQTFLNEDEELQEAVGDQLADARRKFMDRLDTEGVGEEKKKTTQKKRGGKLVKQRRNK